MERVFSVDQLFVHRIPDISIGLLAAKVVDEFFLTGADPKIKIFFDHLDGVFKLSTTSVENQVRFLRCSRNVLSDR